MMPYVFALSAIPLLMGLGIVSNKETLKIKEALSLLGHSLTSLAISYIIIFFAKETVLIPDVVLKNALNLKDLESVFITQDFIYYFIIALILFIFFEKDKFKFSAVFYFAPLFFFMIIGILLEEPVSNTQEEYLFYPLFFSGFYIILITLNRIKNKIIFLICSFISFIILNIAWVLYYGFNEVLAYFLVFILLIISIISIFIKSKI